jgi:hypothetical protein
MSFFIALVVGLSKDTFLWELIQTRKKTPTEEVSDIIGNSVAK